MSEKIVETWRTTAGDKVEVYRTEAHGQRYRWRVRAAGNHEIVGQGEAHSDRADAVTAAERHHPRVGEE